MMQREFNIDQLIGIVDKSNIKVEALYESNLVTSRTHTNFKGYQATFPEFLAAMKSGSIGATAGPVEVDLDIAPVNQLWEEVSGVIAVTNAWMTPFLRLFGVEAGNGLSPFATDINSPSDLRVMIAQFFRAPRRDRRGNNNIDGDVPGDVEDEVDMDVEDEIVEEVNGAVGLLPISVITNHVTEIQQADEEGDESDDDVTVVEENNTTNVVEVEDFFDSGAISAFDYFKALLMCNDINDVSGCALKLVQLLQLGKLESGAITLASKHNSRNGCWFSQKSKTKDNSEGGDGDGDDEGAILIQRDSLIQLSCKRGKSVSVENYRVLAFFTKFYNKWFIAKEEKFVWETDPDKRNNVRVLARLMKKSGSSYREVELVAGGDWGPKQVYCIKNFSDILKVENELVDM